MSYYASEKDNGYLEETRKLHAEYLGSDLSLREFAAKKVLGHSGLRGRFQRANLPVKHTSAYKNRKRLRATEQPLKDVLRCTHCGWRWKRQETKILIPCPNCGVCVNARLFKRTGNITQIQAYRNKNREQIAASARKKKRIDFEHALRIVGRGKMECVSCGCSDLRILEINHINGGGRKEASNKRHAFIRAIVLGERSIEDLNILCKVCNIEHYVKLRFGISGFRIVWDREENARAC